MASDPGLAVTPMLALPLPIAVLVLNHPAEDTSMLHATDALSAVMVKDWLEEAPPATPPKSSFAGERVREARGTEKSYLTRKASSGPPPKLRCGSNRKKLFPTNVR